MIFSTLVRHAFAGAIVIGLTSPLAHAEWETCGGAKLRWPGKSATLRAAIPTDSPWYEALKDAVTKWNYTGSAFHFSLISDDSSFGLKNGQSEVWFTDSAKDLKGSYGKTYWWTDPATCKLTEADILFDINAPWTASKLRSDSLVYDGTLIPFRAVAMHELGHACGSGHTIDTYSIMGNASHHVHANGDSTRYYPGENDVYESIQVYGKTTAGHEDLSVVHWRHSGQWGEYSTHARTRLFDLDGNELQKVPGASDDVAAEYFVVSGTPIRAECTLENRGTGTKQVMLDFVASTNDVISASDDFLGAEAVSFGVGFANTIKSKPMTIHPLLTPGKTYYVGAIVDSTALVDEVLETNNATFLARIRVRIPDLAAKSIAGPNTVKLVDGSGVATVSFKALGKDWNWQPYYELRLGKKKKPSSKDIVVANGFCTLGSKTELTFTIDGVKSGTYRWLLVIPAVNGETHTSNNFVLGNKVKIKKSKG